MTWCPSPKLQASVALIGLAVVAGLASGRPEPVVLVAPIAISLAAGLAMTRRGDVTLTACLDRDRALEGDDVVLSIEVTAASGDPFVEIAVVTGPGCSVVGDSPIGLTLAPGVPRRIDVGLRCDR